MKLTIDEKVCNKHNMTLEEFLVALTVRQVEDSKKVTKELLRKEVLVHREQEGYLVTQHWSDVIDEILCDSVGEIDDGARLLNLAKKMREIYPGGRMPGTVYYYRCNDREVVLKMKKFFLQYGNYSDEKILEATQRYVDSFHGDYRYLPLIKYFISKNKKVTDEDGTVHITEVSPLADYLENREEDVFNDDNWTTKLV